MTREHSYLIADLSCDGRWHEFDDEPEAADRPAPVVRMGIFTAHSERLAVELALATWHNLTALTPGYGLVRTDNGFWALCPRDRAPAQGDVAFGAISLEGLIDLSRLFGAHEHTINGVLRLMRASEAAVPVEHARKETFRNRRWIRIAQAAASLDQVPVYVSYHAYRRRLGGYSREEERRWERIDVNTADGKLLQASAQFRDPRQPRPQPNAATDDATRHT